MPLFSIIGGALMSFLPVTNRNGILAGLYLVNTVVAPLAIFYNVCCTLFLIQLSTLRSTLHGLLTIHCLFSGLLPTSAVPLSARLQPPS
jgi:hypothetical protein